ncbi:hypothetical protein [Campylobacter sp. CNRCH_2016_0050h]|uniref:hypothetical protein n=1 Tax=Campylobacter sp. CNRCH_2016_0050h TaxID=2911608 RepID=UPI0021E6D558|nr:hypothetical protein [Campylobacter sp. CNRCH_2016_0050h]MCV3457590.1 hypothetical protein [Campylobacter sp. CNRCH_2016_0050h]
MEKQELEQRENELSKREQEQETRKQKLNEFSIRLKEQQEKLKKEQEALESEKETYKQEIEDKVNSEFNVRVNQAIEKQTQAVQKEQEILLNKHKDYHVKEIILKKKEQELELKTLEIDNAKKELEEVYEKKLKEEMRGKKAELVSKLDTEFDEKFKEKIDLLEQEREQLAEQKEQIQVERINLNAEKKAFEVSKQKEFERSQDKVQATIDFLQNKLKNEKEENEKLLNEYNMLVESYREYERFKDRDLISEKNELEQERKRLEARLKQVEDDREERINAIQERANKKEQFYNEQLDKIEEYNRLESELNILKIELRNLREQLREQDYYKKEYEKADDRLKQLQSQFMGKEEQIKREEAIKQDYALEIQLNSENKNKENDELKWLEYIESNMKKYGVEYPQRLLYAFHTMLKTASMSPLSVLSGVSGTGKSELPKLYAYFGGFNFLSEAVQPTWDSPASMVGFYNTIEGKFDATNLFKFLVQTSIKSKQEDENAPNPYGLKESMNLILLDELNLAHIELYFAEFLSKFETKRGSDNVNLDIPIGAGLTMPIELDSNLLWVGTMNEDETTKSLSDKVLDRAFCLNFPRPKELVSRLELKKLNDICEFKWLPKTTWESWVSKTQKNINLTKYKGIAEKINEKLAKAHRAIGHRVWQSMEAYMLHYPLIDDREKVLKIAFEDSIVQKIMPKLRGMELHGEEKKVLDEINDIILKEVPNLEKDFKYAMSNPYGQFKFNSAYYLDSQEN